MAPCNLDNQIHLILSGGERPYFPETDLAETSFADVVNLVMSGNCEGGGFRVLCLNPAEGWSRDVTEDVARTCCERAWREGEEPNYAVRQFLDANGLDYPSAEGDAAHHAADYRRSLKQEAA